MKLHSAPRRTALCAAIVLLASACGAQSASNSSDPNSSNAGSTDPSAHSASPETADAVFPAALGTPAIGYLTAVDLAVRRTSDGAASTYVVQQNGTIVLMGDGGRPSGLMADLSASTRERGEQGLLGLVFSLDGATAYVNYTDLDGRTTVDAIPVESDGTFAVDARETIYTLNQPYRNHNGGDLVLSPDGRYLFVFNGDGGSADDPERVALDPNSQLGKIVRIDLERRDDAPQDDSAVSIWAAGLRNPWRAFLDPETEELWIADVGQNEWEEINVVPLADLQGTSFGWSAFEGTVEFNKDQRAAHRAYREIQPIHTYPHQNDDCSISGGAVYRGSSIDAVGTWYLFSDFCGGEVRALCVTPERTACGVTSIGRVDSPVAILPDASGELWVVSLSGRLVPIVDAS